MKTINSASCLRYYGHGRKMSTLSALIYTFTFITLSTRLCDGQPGNTAMFEIPSMAKKFYKLKDCRKMAPGEVDCKCSYIGKECQPTSLKNCRNCSCLDGSTRIFYVKKRYGAVCLSMNNLFNAAGFGEKFLIHSPVFKVCAQARTKIYHTKVCTFKDLRQVWLWTPGNLLMNAETSTCLRTQTKNNRFLPMSLARCNSSDDGQKWKCNDRLWWGVSFPSNFVNITHATRYYSKDPTLNARAIIVKVDKGNKWSVFPTNNQPVCSTIHREGTFYLNDGEIEKSEIDIAPRCPHRGCSKKLITSTNTDSLSNCTIIWDEDLPSDRRPFFIKNQDNGLYFVWRSDPHGKLKGRILDLTIQCLRNSTKFEEYLFRLGIKDIIFEKVPENYLTIQTDSQEQSELPIVDLDKTCTRNVCSRRIKGLETLNKNRPICFIEWKKSTFSRLDNTSDVIVNVTELLFLRKIGKEGFYLKWNLTNVHVLANITFNLTIFCYNDENENATSVKESLLIFQTRYGFIPKSPENSADKSLLYLAIILPMTFALLVVGAVLTIFYTFRRRQRIKELTSKHNLHSNVVVQYSNESVDFAVNLNSNDIECKSEDNPVYEQCIATIPHPAVTIARNQIYEYTHNSPERYVSDVYEIPVENTKDRKNEFYVSASVIKRSPKPNSDSLPKTYPKPSPSTSQKPSPNASPNASPNPSPKPGPKSQAPKKPLTPDHCNAGVPEVMHPPVNEDLYDQPLHFIPRLNRNSQDEVSKEEIAVENLEEQRIPSIYEKPLPDSPPNSGIYEYATREDLPISATRCTAEKPLEFTKGKDHGGSFTSNGSLYDTPHYDVLERT